MAYILTQDVSLSGRQIVTTSATVSGEEFTPGDRTFFFVQNNSGGSVTLTFADSNSEGPTAATSFNPDVTYVIAPGTSNAIGPFPNSRFADPSDGFVHVTYSAVTSVSVAALKLVT